MTGHTIKVLVVEDNVEYADLVRQVLVRGKEPLFSIRHVDRLATGLASLSDGNIDAVLLDLNLPDSQGFETFTKIHAQAPNLPVVILSGNNDESFALDAISHGAQDYLVKGEGEAKVLPRVMRYAIERKKAENAEGFIKELSTNGAGAEGLSGSVAAEELSVAERCRRCDLLPWFEQAVEAGASDLFITVGEVPTLKIFGQFRKIWNIPVSVAKMSLILDSILTRSQSGRFFNEGKEIDFALDVNGLCRFRVNLFRSHEGASLAFRPIPRDIPAIHELGLPEILQGWSRLTKGLVLITGPTGSGKSTTLASLLNEINNRDERHIITIEDPIEFVIPHHRSLVHQREVELHTRSFADGLKSALRENPDIIMAGELRDLESMSLAVRAAETGHLVFSTLHSGSAVQAITRMLDVFEGDARLQVQVQVAESLQGILAQRLLRRLDGSGMALATEVLVPTPAVRNLIRANQLPQIQSYLEMGKEAGMHTMEQSTQWLVEKGLVASEAKM